MNLVERVRATIQGALERLAKAGALGDDGHAAVAAASAWTVERPKRAEHGDLATNVALVLYKTRGKTSARDCRGAGRGAGEGTRWSGAAEIAGPGFVNLRVHPRAIHEELRDIVAAGGCYGRLPSATGERINLEFVSANPTGPLHVGHARGAIFGDAVARLLEATRQPRHPRVLRQRLRQPGPQVRRQRQALAEGGRCLRTGTRAATSSSSRTTSRRSTPGVRGDHETLARVRRPG